MIFSFYLALDGPDDPTPVHFIDPQRAIKVRDKIRKIVGPELANKVVVYRNECGKVSEVE